MRNYVLFKLINVEWSEIDKSDGTIIQRFVEYFVGGDDDEATERFEKRGRELNSDPNFFALFSASDPTPATKYIELNKEGIVDLLNGICQAQAYEQLLNENPDLIVDESPRAEWSHGH